MVKNYKINSENDLSFVMCRILGRVGHVQRHEDKYDSGVPDLSYSLPGDNNGWLELKFKCKMPINHNSKIIIRHLTPAQIEWLENRGKYCNNCNLLIYVGNDFLLIPHYNLKKLRHTQWKNIEKITIRKWKNDTKPLEIISIFNDLN